MILTNLNLEDFLAFYLKTSSDVIQRAQDLGRNRRITLLNAIKDVTSSVPYAAFNSQLMKTFVSEFKKSRKLVISNYTIAGSIKVEIAPLTPGKNKNGIEVRVKLGGDFVSSIVHIRETIEGPYGFNAVVAHYDWIKDSDEKFEGIPHISSLPAPPKASFTIKI